jgi:hypothetical protein
MPIPAPTQAESESEFIERCMTDDKLREEFPSNDQRYAVCRGQWTGAMKAELHRLIEQKKDELFALLDALERK